MWGHGARQDLVEGFGDLIETFGVGEAVALADVFADEFAEFRAGFGIDLGGIGAGFAEFGEFAGFSQVQQMPPDFGAAGFGVGLGGGVGVEEAFEMRGVGEIVGGSADLLVNLDQQIFLHGGALFDAGEEAGGGFGVFDAGCVMAFFDGAIEEH